MVSIKILSYLPSIDVIIYKKITHVHELFGQPSYIRNTAEFKHKTVNNKSYYLILQFEEEALSFLSSCEFKKEELDKITIAG
jgi:hypothetical protein